MENVMALAYYLGKQYKKTYGNDIDEMKMHKLLYLAQRESLIEYDRVLFSAEIHGWKYGPVILDVRKMFINGKLIPATSIYPINNITSIKLLNNILNKYGNKTSWSLSRLTHGEYSWKQSRIGVPENENSDNVITIDDMKKDALKIKYRREVLAG